MAIDSSIYQMSGRGVKSVNEYNAEAQQAQQNKLALMAGMQTNELNKLKMDEYQRGVQQSNALRVILSGEYKDPTERQNAMIKGGFLKEATDYSKNNADVAKTESESKAKQMEVAQKRLDLAGSAFGFVRQNPTPENAIAAIDHLVSNGIYSPEQGNEYKAKVTANPGNVAQMADLAFRGALAAKEQLVKNQSVNLGGTQENQSIDPVSGKVSVLSSAPITQSADNKATVGATYARLAEDKRHNTASESNQSLTLQQGKVPSGYRALPDGSLTFIPGGPADPKTAQKATDAKDVLGLLDEVDVLLPKATGSMIGSAVDATAGAFGKSTAGAEATAQLKALQGALVSKMPKMTGPQSDKDVLLYREMAGQVADNTLPVSQRQAASKTIRKLNEKYAGMAPGSSKGRTVVKTGTLDGRKVVQYSDGSTDYAD